jgi:hypothetical protein
MRHMWSSEKSYSASIWLCVCISGGKLQEGRGKCQDGRDSVAVELVYSAVLRTRIRIRMFLGLLDPDPDPLVRGMES